MPTYDHEVLIGTTKRGLVIARDQNGQALSSIEEKVLEYQDPLYFRQTNWSGGHGQYDFVKKDVYFDGQSIDTTVEGKVFLGPLINVVDEDNDSDLDTPPICFGYFKSLATPLPLMATTSKIYHLDAGGWDLATTVDGTVAGVTSFHEYNGIMYAARGTTGAYLTSTDGLTWTESVLTNHHANGFFTAPNPAGTQDVLWKRENPNQITNTTNGHTGGVDWSSPAYIGDTTTNITNIFMVNNYMMIGKTDDMFYYDSDGGVHPLMTELDTSKSTQNFKYVANWQTGAYFSLVDGLAEITSYNAYDTVGPLTRIDDISKIGTVIALTSDKDWIYCIMDEGTNNIIYKGREVTRNGETKWVWCPWIFLGTNACTCAMVMQHSLTDRRLWFGYGANTAYAILSDNPLADSAARFAPAGFVRMSYLNGTSLHYDKMFQQTLVTETEDCSATVTVQPKYRKDSGTTMEILTPIITTNGTVETSLSNPIAGNKFQFEIDLATGASTATPQVLFFQMTGLEKPDVIRIIHATYVAGDTPNMKVSVLRDLLRTARTTTSLIKWADLRFTPSGTSGTEYSYVVMEPGYPKEVEIFKGKDKGTELGFEVAWRVAV
jgi:hypothetical protein